MGRSNYSDDLDNQQIAMWRGQVASALRGKRGQKFLRELVSEMDAMPEKRLISSELIKDGEVCALGSVGRRRGIDLTSLDPEDHYELAKAFDIARPLVMEIEWHNDEAGSQRETPEERWQRMRAWATSVMDAA